MARVEVFTGPERRRRWSEEQKRATVAASLAPGAVVADVGIGDAVRHALVAERVNQPIEDRRRIVSLHRGDDAVSRQADSGVVDNAQRARDLADEPHQPDCSAKPRRIRN
jgi:hypothetical protein